MSPEVDYARQPAEDFARATVKYVDEAGLPLIVEATTSWSFVGAGLRLTMELLGPEYSMSSSTLDTGTKVFLSRRLHGLAGEDLVEKQNAEQGLMPLVGNESAEYGYEAENRAFVTAFANGVQPELDFHAGRDVTELLMTCYMSAEQGRVIPWKPEGLARVRAPGGPGAGGATIAAPTTRASGAVRPALALAAGGDSSMRDGSTNALTAAESAAGWRLLFDGTTLNGWRGFKTEEPPPSWNAVDGTLLRVAEGGDLMTVEQYGDFELAARVEGAAGGQQRDHVPRHRAPAPAPTRPGPRCSCSTTAAIPTARTRGPRPAPTTPCTPRSATSPGRSASGTPYAWSWPARTSSTG